MELPSSVFGVAPWVIITAVISWFASIYANREKAKNRAVDKSERLEVHRDDMILAIIKTGRAEITAARTEVSDLRDEVTKLRAMETHFYHFQQSLDHLEALLTAATPEERTEAERNARAFLNRMRRLQNAKGTITNEVQRAASEMSLAEHPPKPKKDPNDADG